MFITSNINTNNMKNSLKIRVLRHQKGFDQHQMASELNITVADYSRIECGLTALDNSILKQLIKIFGLSINDFSKWQGKRIIKALKE
jgi:transcriptional regulator with XRE-family HTH domain